MSESKPKPLEERHGQSECHPAGRSGNQIEEKIDELLGEFRANPEIVLTEDDFRCQLYTKLKSVKEFSELSETADGDGIVSLPLHTEVRWYGEDHTLKTRSDIVIIPVSGLKTRDKKPFTLLSKGYAFDGPVAIIELKLRRRNGPSNAKFKKDIESDLEKLEELREKVSEQSKRYLVILDKRESIRENLPENDSETILKYVSSSDD